MSCQGCRSLRNWRRFNGISWWRVLCTLCWWHSQRWRGRIHIAGRAAMVLLAVALLLLGGWMRALWRCP